MELLFDEPLLVPMIGAGEKDIAAENDGDLYAR